MDQDRLYHLQGCLSYPHIGSDWSQIGQIRDFFRSDSVHFGSASPRFIIFGANLTQFGCQI